jgi:hypothetical protein
MLRRGAAVSVVTLLVLSVFPAAAGPPKRHDMREGYLGIAREHQRNLQMSIPRRERDLREASASLDRVSALFARGLLTRQELDAAAREVGKARAQLDWERTDLRRTTMLIVEIEARRTLENLQPLRPGQYEVSDRLIRYLGSRELSDGELSVLGRHVAARGGSPLVVSAMGQSDVHTRLGLDHRHAVDLAVHPDSVEGRLVMAWLRERRISFLAFRGPQSGAATGAHIHVGRPSVRWGARDEPPLPSALRDPAKPGTSPTAAARD